MKGSLRLLAGAVTLALGLSACGGSSDSESGSSTDLPTAGETGTAAAQIQQLYKAAQDNGETEVNFYPVYSSLQPVVDVFNKTFSKVHVNVTPLFGANLLSKISAEQKSGKVQGDVVVQDTASAAAVTATGYVTPWKPDDASTLPADDSSKDGNWNRVFNTYNGVSYNTSVVKAADVPDTLDGFFTDAWKGKFAYVQPTGFQLSDIVFTTLTENKRLTTDQLKKLKEYGVAIASSSDLLPKLAQGQGDIRALLWAPTQGVEVLRQQGAPLESKPIGQQTFYQAGAVALVKDAPHPDAAKLFIAWLYSKEGQKALAEHHASYGTIPGSPNPPGYPDLTPYKLTPLSFENATQVQQSLYNSTLKSIFGPPLS